MAFGLIWRLALAGVTVEVTDSVGAGGGLGRAGR